MKIKTILAASAIIAAMSATPSFAQIASGTSAGPTTGGIGVGNTATSTSTSTDLQIQDSGNDNSQTALASFNSLGSNNTDSNHDNGNDSSVLVADQELNASVTNAPVLALAGVSAVNSNSGNNAVQGSAFAAYSGILNQGWNNGQGSNAQAATNIAARGSVSFSQ